MLNSKESRRHRSLAIRVAASLYLIGLGLPAKGAPVITEFGYTIELFVAGAGAVDGLAFNGSGDLFFTDYDGGRILTVSSPSTPGPNAFSVYATGIAFPTDLAFTSDGRLFVTSSTSSNSNVIEVVSDGSSSVFSSGFSFPTSIESVGTSLFVSNSGDGTITGIDSSGSASLFLSGFSQPYGLSASPSGDLYFAEHSSGNIYTSNPVGSVQLLGSLSSSLGATFTAYAPSGDIFVSDVAEGSVYRLDESGGLSLFATGFDAKSNPPFIGPTDLAFDSAGNLYVGDGSSIWKVTAVPIIPSFWLFGSGLISMLFVRRHSANQSSRPANRCTV